MAVHYPKPLGPPRSHVIRKPDPTTLHNKRKKRNSTMNTNDTATAETIADQARASAAANQTGPAPQQGPANANFDTTTAPAPAAPKNSNLKRYIVGGVAVCALGVAAYFGYKRFVAS